jgi:dephospho-CoA kinase
VLAVGLTGGIACGKTVIRLRFEAQGVPTLDADRVVHGLFAPGTEVTQAVRARFGANVLAADGSVDRKALGTIVFQDAAARESLEAIVHPKVFEAIETFLDNSRNQSADIAVVDAALMYETTSYERYDRIVVAYCPPEVQQQRLMTRDGLSREQAQRRIDAQMSVEEKRDLADYVIDTSGTMEQTLQQTDRVLEQLLEEAKSK